MSAISGTSSSTPRPGSRTASREAQVDLGLAAAGDAVQQRGVIRRRRRRARQRVERRLLLVGQRRPARARDRRDGAVERIALDPAPLDRRRARARPAARRVGGDVRVGELGERHAVRRAAQQVERLLLPRAERRADELLGALRRERATRTVRDASAVPCSGCVSVIRPSRSSADERAVCAARLLRQRADRHDASARQRVEDVAPRAALGQQRAPRRHR